LPLVEIVARCLRREASARYASGAELKAAIELVPPVLSTPSQEGYELSARSAGTTDSTPSPAISLERPAVFSPPVERATPEPLEPPRPVYARVRGSSVAYQAFGRGPPNLVLLPGAMTHIGATWTHPAPVALLTTLASFSRVVLLDHRGSGLSDPLDEPASLGASVEDIVGVMSAASIDKAIVVAASEAAHSALALAATRPEHVQGIVLFGAGATFAELDDLEAPVEDVWDHLDSWFPKHWGDPTLAALEAPTLSSDAEYVAWFTQYHLLAATPRRAASTLRGLRIAEPRSSASHVRAPTLELRRAGDAVVSEVRAEALTARIPGARYAEISGDDHFLFAGDGPVLAREIQLFAASLRETELSTYASE
jgi:pimeloyl-ACP methyl ester carboxylesterase